MTKNILLLLAFFISIFGIGIAQNTTTYTLEKCIEIAINNNLDLKSSILNAKTSKINYKQSKLDILPNLNADYNIGINNGRSIDPFTNDYINQELTFSNAGLSLNTTIFNGFRMMNSIKQNKFNLKASEMEIEEAKQNLILEVTLQYIQILNNRDLINLSKSRLETTENQLKRLETLYKEGSINPVNYTDMQGQYSIDEMGVVTAENSLKSSVLELMRLLNLDTNSEKTFENIFGLVASEKYQFSVDEIYKDALQNLATFKSKELKIEAADKGIKVAKSNYFPSISLFGQLNTNYSSVAQSFTETGSTVTETGDFVNINNQEYPVLMNETQFDTSKIDYNDQFDNNLNSVVGVSVNIPLFNGFRAKNSVSLQKIQLEESEIELERTKTTFKQSIEDAYNNMESAFDRYHILLNQVKVFEESFRVNEIRFNNGVSNIVEYITSKNNLDTAKLNLNKTKYEYLLRVKILDYYRGV
ncbi:TolC family protein [Urechidicola croceus]|uniref:Transporter n=1 Tax=Urechidicola croceus TaxID=1850246 RepID=A0A1D8P5N3_9FLAO|nr:TolC family protein [Urechidicola croceus]AOW19885.1 transporter [Urechidicola croceus]